MGLFIRLSFAFSAALMAANGYAVVQLQVDARDVSAMQGAEFAVLSIDGVDASVETRRDGEGAVIALDFDTIADARGATVTITPSNNTPTFTVAVPRYWDGSPLVVDFVNQRLLQEPVTTPNASRPSRRQIQIDYGTGGWDATPWGTPAGISLGPDNEIRVLPVDSNQDFDSLGVRFEIPVTITPLFQSLDMRAGFRYWDWNGDDRDAAQVASGGDDVFSVFLATTPTFGTGFFGGPIGIQTQYDLDWEGDRYELDFSWRPDCDLPGSIEMRPNFGLYWGSYNFDYDASAVFIDAPEVTVATHQRLDSDFWGATLGVDFSLPISQRWAINLGLGARYQDMASDLSSTQDIDFFGTLESIRLEADDDESSFGLRANVGLSYQINERIGVTFDYAIDSGTSVPGGFNQVSGTPVSNGRVSEIDYNDHSDSFSLGLSMAF